MTINISKYPPIMYFPSFQPLYTYIRLWLFLDLVGIHLLSLSHLRLAWVHTLSGNSLFFFNYSTLVSLQIRDVLPNSLRYDCLPVKLHQIWNYTTGTYHVQDLLVVTTILSIKFNLEGRELFCLIKIISRSNQTKTEWVVYFNYEGVYLVKHHIKKLTMHLLNEGIIIRTQTFTNITSFHLL